MHCNKGYDKSLGNKNKPHSKAPPKHLINWVFNFEWKAQIYFLTEGLSSWFTPHQLPSNKVI